MIPLLYKPLNFQASGEQGSVVIKFAQVYGRYSYNVGPPSYKLVYNPI